MRKHVNRKGESLVKDYYILDKMSKSLSVHRKAIKVIARKIAKKVNPDFGIGLVENLDAVATHLERAEKEMAKAKHGLKRI